MHKNQIVINDEFAPRLLLTEGSRVTGGGPPGIELNPAVNTIVYAELPYNSHGSIFHYKNYVLNWFGKGVFAYAACRAQKRPLEAAVLPN